MDLIGYYRKIVKKYGAIAAPIIALLRKNVFVWSNKAQKAFERLKAAIVNPLCYVYMIFLKRLLWSVMLYGKV